MRKRFTVMKTIVYFVCLATGCILLGHYQQYLPYQFKNVLSGSMEPTFLTGSVILIRTAKPDSKYHVGDVITFQVENNASITHRIIGEEKRDGRLFFKTKGDNNDGPDGDLVPREHILGSYTGLTVPYIGYFFILFYSKLGTLIFMIIPGLILLYAAYRILVKKNKRSLPNGG